MAGDWRLLSDNPYLGTRVWELELDENHTIRRTEYYAANDFMEANAAERNASDGQRFGDMAKVASVPMHIWAREIVPRVQDGNHASIRKWLNASDNRPFRTFRGNV